MDDSEKFQSICKMYERGQLTNGEATRIFNCMQPERAVAQLKEMPPKLQKYILSLAANAPILECDWARPFSIRSWCGPWNADIAEEVAHDEVVESAKRREILERVRKEYANETVLYRSKALPYLNMKAHGILELSIYSNNKLSLLIAEYVLGWTRDQNDIWTDTHQGVQIDGRLNFFHIKPSHQVPDFWMTLKYFHPWTIGNADTGGAEWAPIILTSYSERDYDFEPKLGPQLTEGLVVFRDATTRNIPWPRNFSQENGFFWDNELTAANFTAGKSFCIVGSAPEIICKALLLAKLDRQKLEAAVK